MTASNFSAKVLERKQKKRLKRMRLWTVSIALAGLLADGAYLTYKAIKIDAPTWADFEPMKNGDVQYELKNGFMTSGAPTELTINGERWSLVLINHFNDVDMTKVAVSDPRMAQTDCKHRTISYIATTDPARLKINLMHEVFHAGDCLHGGDSYWNSPVKEDPKNPHPGIYHLGEFTSSFLHDNPDFAKWEAQ